MKQESERYDAFPLMRDERPKIKYVYTVTGRGMFPFDMLRYDQCWPSDSESAARMDISRDLRSIQLSSYSQPTIGRWTSFLWSVGHLGDR